MLETDSQSELRPETAILLANLGTPDAPEARHVGRFLTEFLSDPRVVDLPRWLWLPLLYLVIVPLQFLLEYNKRIHLLAEQVGQLFELLFGMA